jgi:YgiT-type zinc finger domain-containing protein
MKVPETDLTIPCNECQAGQMRRVFVTYFTWLGDELITVPDFPAWRCAFNWLKAARRARDHGQGNWSG